jgi:hypothetical protein
VSERGELYRDPPPTAAVDELVARLDALVTRVRRDYAAVALDPALVDDLYDRLADLRDALEEVS